MKINQAHTACVIISELSILRIILLSCCHVITVKTYIPYIRMIWVIELSGPVKWTFLSSHYPKAVAVKLVRQIFSVFSCKQTACMFSTDLVCICPFSV